MDAKFHNRGKRDLFEQFQTVDKKVGKKTGILLPYLKKNITLSYENIIFLAIGFIIFCIVFFSLGVEKGRQDINHVRKEKGAPERQSTRAPEEEQKPENQIQNKYIIQLAAFKKRESAEHKLTELKKEGYQADIKKSGDYYQVYISGFEKKRNAQKLLEELRKKYKDCYIKKL